MLKGSASRVALLAAALMMFVGVTEASAGVPPMLRSGTHPWFATFNFGPAIKMKTAPTQFKIGQEVGYHLWGRSDGPAIGGSLEESFGDSVFTFNLSGKFWWDIQVVRGLSLYLTPSGRFGFIHANAEGNGGAFNGMSLALGFEARLIIGNRGLVFFRPFGLDFMIGDGFGYNFLARYEMMFGGGATF
ncbi:MAG: hypothetical protein H6707_00465 [Deltaproteobacteria bacterium]|nr:hypothetical protein [Deltaproteobacteria bacterium]